MSDTLRDLVVSLSLNSDNFTRNLKSITRQIQEAQSEFRLASAGVTGFESSTSGLSAKLNTLQRTLQLQKNAVGQYERALTNLKNKALLVAQTFGDDLNPTLQKIIEGVSDFVDKLSTLDTSLKMDFGADTVAELSAYVSEMVKAVQQGEQLPEEDLQNLQDIVDFLNGLDVTDTGAHIKEGIAQGMTEAGFASDAETVASNLETALNTALDIHSPSKRVAPVGENVSAGVGEGMTGYNFASSAERIAQSIQSVLKATLTVSSLRAIGVNAMAGLAAGIRAGQANVVAAMRTAAQSAVTAAKTELKIHSPSRVFRDEVGAQVMRGFGLGVERETSNQAKVIANAARYLTGEAKEASIGYNTSYDQRKYDQSSSVSVSGNSFYIREEQDVRSLAIEIAALTRRQCEAIPQTRTQRPRLWVMGEKKVGRRPD